MLLYALSILGAFSLLLSHTTATTVSILNATVHGRLQIAKPLAAPCFQTAGNNQTTTFNQASCDIIRDEAYSDIFRASEYSGFLYSQGQTCVSNPADQCLLNETTLAPLGTSCNQGIVSPMYIEVQDAGDVLAAYNFSRQTGIPLSIKNSGIDYATRSSLQGSLALWTHRLTDMKLEPAFVPANCHSNGSRPVPAVTIGAGVSHDQVFTFAHQHQYTFVGGSMATIGASGGWLLNGGHGVLSGGLGLGADRVLEFTIVTPSGGVRIANEYTNPDLFWALRGGGAAAYGVVLSSTHLLEPEMPLTTAILSFPGTLQNMKPYAHILAENARNWSLSGWGGPSNSNATTILVNRLLNVSEAEESLAPAIEYVRSVNGSITVESLSSFYEFYRTYINGTYEAAIPFSTAVLPTTRIIPESAFLNATRRSQMVDEIADILANGLAVSIEITMPLSYGRGHPQPNTSIHPVWYNSVWQLATSYQWSANSSLQQRRAVVDQLRQRSRRFEAVAPDGAVYSNEANPWTTDWQNQFWGAENYARLLEIKNKYDPDRLLTCWRCVGWDETLSNYHCMQDVDMD